MIHSEVVQRLAILKRRAGRSAIVASIAGALAAGALLACAVIWIWTASISTMDAIEVQMPASVQAILSRTAATGPVSSAGATSIVSAVEDAAGPLGTMGSVIAAMLGVLTLGVAFVKQDPRHLLGLFFAGTVYAASMAVSSFGEGSSSEGSYRQDAARITEAIKQRDVASLHAALVREQLVPEIDMTFLEAQVAARAEPPVEFDVAAALRIVQSNVDVLKPTGATLYLLESHVWGGPKSAGAKAFEYGVRERVAIWRGHAGTALAIGGFIAVVCLCTGAFALGIKRRLRRIAALGVTA